MIRTTTAAVAVLFISAHGLSPLAIAATPQQNKMNACNEQANAKGFGEGKGDERKAFMKECLSAKATPMKSGGSQQNKMKSCNKEAGAKNLKGDERKQFMSSCLSN